MAEARRSTERDPHSLIHCWAQVVLPVGRALKITAKLEETRGTQSPGLPQDLPSRDTRGAGLLPVHTGHTTTVTPP